MSTIDRMKKNEIKSNGNFKYIIIYIIIISIIIIFNNNNNLHND